MFIPKNHQIWKTGLVTTPSYQKKLTVLPVWYRKLDILKKEVIRPSSSFFTKYPIFMRFGKLHSHLQNLDKISTFTYLINNFHI